jgi:DMSO/TMAO reductase YedYZ molybdopterin-dependent catalytic subunit
MFNDFSSRLKNEQRVLQEGRLPPGQSLTQKFPILHYGSVPDFNPTSWALKIWGEVEEPITWSWEEFQHLPRTQIQIDLHCVTRWSKFDTVWDGVSVRQLIEQGFVKPKDSARYVLQHAEFGFTVNLPLEVVLQDSFLLATQFNGEPLTPEHGYPLRGVVGAIPGRDDLKTPYLWKGAKWLRGLEFLSENRLGFWEQAGYHNEGDVWKEQRLAGY